MSCPPRDAVHGQTPRLHEGRDPPARAGVRVGSAPHRGTSTRCRPVAQQRRQQDVTLLGAGSSGRWQENVGASRGTGAVTSING